MTSNPLLSGSAIAAATATATALIIVARRPRMPQNWWLLLGMCVSATAVILDACTSAASDPHHARNFHAMALEVRSLLPGTWLAFSITFARAPGRPFRRRSLVAITLAFVMPVALAITFRNQLVADIRRDDTGSAWVSLHTSARMIHVMVLAGLLVAMMKLEAIFRSSVGTTRWRLKFVLLGVAVLLGSMAYTRTQSVLFSQQPTDRSSVDAMGLLLAAGFLIVGMRRGGFDPQDVVSPKLSLGHSVTVFVAGTYLFVVGVLAQVIVFLGKSSSFQIQALVVLVSIATVSAILLSDRARQRIHAFFSRVFSRPAYDFREVWTQFSRQLSTEHHAEGVCTTAARLISDTFHVLSTRVWVRIPGSGHLQLGASTAPSSDEALASAPEGALPVDLQMPASPFDLEKADGRLAEVLRRCSPGHFRQGGNRLAVPLFDHDRAVGVAVLADRVNGTPYTPEEIDLLECIATQVAATLMNLRITKELVQAKELEAFQTMSAFFVHDLKNAVSTLNLMLQNLPVHFANPEFRQDALRGIGNTAERVNHLIARLSALRGKLELRRVPADLHEIIRRSLASIGPLEDVRLNVTLDGEAPLLADAEHLGSVISNLVLNARDAATGNPAGEITISTRRTDQQWEFQIQDNGAGMTPEFIETSLFRPFSSTKAKGLGIGMFQCKTIIESHQGKIQVQSEPGKGTRILVMLPTGLPASPGH